ncbi:MAG: hypothetical protein A2381_19555 [Bdellovibrionales bacterium RIFOXYB1_FULL_37_110]|nr:MAG: hypothetical protein A2417_11055 [Bdellovibrionales bacterium RIFOXYC1_FULL_37_79]OFZ60676.1 MAG: hypothetical protein A2381_19555 [Bdellovibrionales bacterium RIFOXYB1_FULL_37_110]OFZ64428.1 MAG: hypothetical protein A2577_10205 [Bdellovibrionales bacterium RIFOXYD1_FULL_36_51]
MTLQLTRINICIFASGNGTNAINLIRESKKYGHIKVVGLLCDNPSADILQKIKPFDIPALVVPFKGNKLSHEKEILAQLSHLDIHWIFLAGYMRILSANFINQFKLSGERSRIINIHPSLLPAFKGKDAYQQAFDSGVSQSGVTIHLVDSGIDSGEVILQEAFLRLDTDTFPDFKSRGMQLEYLLYPQVLKMISQNSIDFNKDIAHD